MPHKRDPRYLPEQGCNGVQRACTDLLTVHRIWWMRCNSVVFQGQNGHKYRAGQKGMADVLMTPHICDKCPVSVPVWCEFKSTSGKQTDFQKAFQAEVEKAGHLYLLINDPQQLIDWLKEFLH